RYWLVTHRAPFRLYRDNHCWRNG
ncbi:MMPL family protein, partial [Vibrio parahaemolyticus VPTS-2010]